MPGLSVSLSSLSDQHRATSFGKQVWTDSNQPGSMIMDPKQVWMDPSLWGALPEPLVELILAHLPLPELLPMRAVCQKWNALLRAPLFLASQRSRTVQCPAYVLTVNEPALSAFAFFQRGAELYYLRTSSLYCPVAKNWFNMSLDCLPCRDFYVTSVGGGLLCFVGYKPHERRPGAPASAAASCNREVVIGVCNPATRSWRVLPHWGDAKPYNLPVFVAMVVDNYSRSYRIVLIDHDRAATWSYQSTTAAWTAKDSVPARHSFPFYDRGASSPVVARRAGSNAALVCATQCKTGIATFDMATGEWDSYHVFLPGMHSNVHLVQHHGRILMISRVMKMKYEGSDRLQISELDPHNLRATTALDDVPLGPSKQFLDHFKVCGYSSVEDSEGLCFVSVTTGERWLYALEERSWHILPSSPGRQSKSMASYGGFSVHLRVDMQP